MERFVRGYIGVTGLLSIGNAVQVLESGVLSERLFDALGKRQVNPLFSRLFAHFHIMVAIIRFMCCYSMDNQPVFLLASISYVQCVVYYSVELLWFRSGTLNIGTVSNIVIPALSLILMSVYIIWAKTWVTQQGGRRKKTKIQFSMKDHVMMTKKAN